MTRRRSLLPIVLAATAALTGIGAALHAQGTVQTAPSVETRPSLREWQFPGMQPQTDDGYQKVAMITGVAVGDYAQVLDFYARKMGASGYDPKGVARFQPQGHSSLSGMGINPGDGAGSCYADAQIMHATLCRRFEHEAVTVSLSEDKQSRQIHISLTDTSF